MQILITEIDRLRKELNKTVEKLEKEGYKRAKTDYEYRIALAQELLRNKDKGLPATLNNDVSRGNTAVAMLRFRRDKAEALYEATLEKLRILKIEIGIVERQIEAIRRGE